MRRVLEIDRAMPHETELLEALRTVSRRLSLLVSLLFLDMSEYHQGTIQNTEAQQQYI
jgi:hypothetical protein